MENDNKIALHETHKKTHTRKRISCMFKQMFRNFEAEETTSQPRRSTFRTAQNLTGGAAWWCVRWIDTEPNPPAAPFPFLVAIKSHKEKVKKGING